MVKNALPVVNPAVSHVPVDDENSVINKQSRTEFVPDTKLTV